MTHPLDGALAKVDRANEHLQELEADILRVPFDPDAIHFGQKFDPDTSTIEVTLQGIPDLPVRWGLLAADCLHNLRAALNYLTWELSIHNLAKLGVDRLPSDNTQFPIAYRRWRGIPESQIADLSADHARRIKAIQPNSAMHLSQFPEKQLRVVDEVQVFTSSHVFTPLAILTNDDKHRVLTPSALAAQHTQIGNYEGINCRVDHANFFLQARLENGAKWAELEVTPTGSGEPEVKVNDRIEEIFIRFGSPPSLTSAIVLSQIAAATRGTIMEFWADLA